MKTRDREEKQASSKRGSWNRLRARLIWIVKSWVRPASSESRWQQDSGKKHGGR